MDIVIPYKHSQSEELRYCLRSLKNISHDDVFICGDKPDFISDKVIYIPRVITGSYPQYDCELNLRLALNDNRLSENFIMMNDDFYILKPIEKLKTYQNGTLKQLIIDRQQKQFSSYNKIVQNTINYLSTIDNPTSFELHIPMIFNKSKRLELSNDILLKLSAGIKLLPRSVYGNSFCDINEYRKDVKLYLPTDKLTDDTFASTYDSSFNGNVSSIIRSILKEKSIYER